MSRKTAREIAFKVIFAINFQSEEANFEEVLDALIKESENKEDIVKEDTKYIEEVSKGVLANITVIDELIKKYLKGWTMDRISKTDLAILRLATYEIIYRDDIPFKVSVNEAVELAKMFSDETSPSFINGVLAGISKEKGR